MRFYEKILILYVEGIGYVLKKYVKLRQEINKWWGVLKLNKGLFLDYRQWKFWRHWDDWTHAFFRKLVYITIIGSILFYLVLCYILLGYIPTPSELLT